MANGTLIVPARRPSMRFVCDGRVYESADMRMFRTADPSIPWIYLSRDGRATFVVNRDSDGALCAHRAATGEIIALSRRHGIAGLLGAFPSTFAPARIVPPESQDPPCFEPLILPADHALSGTLRAGVLT